MNILQPQAPPNLVPECVQRACFQTNFERMHFSVNSSEIKNERRGEDGEGMFALGEIRNKFNQKQISRDEYFR